MRPDYNPANHRKAGSADSKCRPVPGDGRGTAPRNVRLSNCPAEPRAWCLTALQPLFLRRGAPRPPLPSAGQPRGAWCFTALQPLFLRRGAPRPPLRSARQPRGRGASFPASPCSFVGMHHVRLPNCPARPRDVVLHTLLTLVPSSACTTYAPSKCRPAPGTWCFIPR